jgi:glutathione peroxidase
VYFFKVEVPPNAMKTVYDFHLQSLDGAPLPLSQFVGRPMVVVNTASQCVFTPQYRGLQKMCEDFGSAGLVVLGVPSDDFGGQEPGASDQIATFCTQNYGVTFPLTTKRHVRGPNADPLFRWLGAQGGFFARPRWNFYKYLIGRDGHLRTWFGAITDPQSGRFQRAVRGLLAEK